jgi:hypothetical protein
MYEFLDRMITLAFPRVKDFRGVSPDGFDKGGNYNFGFTEQTVFPEVDAATVTFPQGMNITMVTTARKPEEGRELLKQFGFPFRVTEGRTRRSDSCLVAGVPRLRADAGADGTALATDTLGMTTWQPKPG